MTPLTKRQVKRHLSVRTLLLSAAVLVAVAAAYPLEIAREAAARGLIHLSFAVTDGSTADMRVAGWLMFMAGPAAAVWFGHDFRRAVASARAPQPTGLARFQGRRRPRNGHRARRPIRFWLLRAPLALPILTAVVFVIPFGFVGHGSSNWASLPGGTDFLFGVKWSLIATFTAGVLVIGTESVMLSEPKRWVSRLVSAIAVLTSIGALGIVLSS